MSTQSIIQIHPNEMCDRIDRYIACMSKSYLTYHRYKVGSNPDIRNVAKVDHLRRILCEGNCYICPEDKEKIAEYINKLLC